MGIVGGILISHWACLLIKTTGLILLDGGVDHSIKDDVLRLVEGDNESKVADLHEWRVGSKDVALNVSGVTGEKT